LPLLDFKALQTPESGYNLTLSLDCSSVPKLAPGIIKIESFVWVYKGVKGAEKEAIRRAEEEFFDKYKEQLAYFRRHFFSSPFEKVFKKALTGKMMLLYLLT